MLSKLEMLFNAAADRGFKQVRLRYNGLLFKRAPDTGRNKGAVYVMRKSFTEDEYLGKIQNDCFWPVQSAERDTEVRNIVTIVMNDPVEYAIKYGHKTGNCSICGRHLDNKISVFMGIGPICAEKLGIPIEMPPSEEVIDKDCI